MDELSARHWDELYKSGKTGWDIGYVSTPIKEYFNQLEDRSISILIPGAGNGYEAEYLFKIGFTSVYGLDYSSESINNFKLRNPDFPKSQLIHENFFEHSKQYDIIVEQTFFSSLSPGLREAYVNKMYGLLKPTGKLIGLLFGHEFDFQGPPFGGTLNIYKDLFSSLFTIITMKIAYNSIKPRAEKELFFIVQKKSV